MSDLREALDRRARGVHAEGDALQRVQRRAERRKRRRRITAMVLPLVIAGAGSVGAYLAIPRGERAPVANGPSPTPRIFGEKTITVDGVPFTISGSSSPDGPCIGVSAPGGAVGGGCGGSGGPFQWGQGGLRVNGQLYNVAFGEAPPDASSMEVVMGDGSTLTADTAHGLWLVVVPASEGDPASDFKIVKAQDGAGNVLAQVHPPSLAALRAAQGLAEEPCADDVSQGAPPATGDPKMVGVYFSCRADSATIGTPRQPVYLAMREIPAQLTDTLDERLEGAVRAYIAGPTPEEQDSGYFSAAPSSLARAIQEVRIDGSAAVIDFSPKVGGQLGNLGTTTATDVFIIELRATVFQFDRLDQLTLQIEGDCEQFWRLLERTCTVIRRTEG
jgi:hypothetical protein